MSIPVPRKPRLRLTTPVTRLRNLPLIEAHPEMKEGPKHFDLLWDLLIDCHTLHLNPSLTYYTPSLRFARVRNVLLERPDPRFGEDLYNAVLEEMDPDEWHYGFADDSLIVPGFFEALRAAIDGGAEAVVFPMTIGDGHHCNAHADALHRGVVSGGQLAFRRSVAGDLRWKTGDKYLDGIFVEDLWRETGHRAPWRFLEGPTLAHNQLPR